jgi:hypothetical protein
MADEQVTIGLNLDGTFAAQAERDASAALKLEGALAKLGKAKVDRANATPMTDALAGSAGYGKLSAVVSKIFGSAAGEKLDRAAASLALSADKLGISPEMLSGAGTVLAGAASAVASAGAVVAGAAAALTAAAGALVFAGIKLGISEATKNEVQGAILDAVTGGKGDSAIKVATKVALDIGIDDDAALDKIKKLLNAKFSEKQAAAVVKVGVGLDALETGRGEAFVKTLETIRNLNKFDDKSLRKLAKQGIDLEAVYARLAKEMGLSVDQVKAKIKSGTLDVGKGLDAVVAVADAKFGAVADKIGNSIPGLVTKIQVAFKGLFGDIDLGPLKGFLKNVLGVLTGPAAQGFSKAFSKLTDTILKGLFGPLSDKSAAQKMTAIVKGITGAVTWLTGALKEVGSIAQKVWAAIKPQLADFFSAKKGSTGNELRALGRDLTALWAQAKPVVIPLAKLIAGGLLSGLTTSFKLAVAGARLLSQGLTALLRPVNAIVGAIGNVGRAIPNALGAGILGSMGAAISAAVKMAMGVVAGVKAAIGMKSPPRAFLDIGGAMPNAVGKGVNDNASAPARAGAKMAKAAAVAASAASREASAARAGGGGASGGGRGAGASGAGPTIQITNNFAPGTTPAQAAALATANAEEWKRQMRAWQREQQEGRAA